MRADEFAGARAGGASGGDNGRQSEAVPVLGSTFLPVTPAETAGNGWDGVDFVLASGDAYVDHPSFGAAIIGRVLAAAGYRVAMLPQPRFDRCDDFKAFGRPRLGFLISGGVVDSMVAHYTVA